MVNDLVDGIISYMCRGNSTCLQSMSDQCKEILNGDNADQLEEHSKVFI